MRHAKSRSTEYRNKTFRLRADLLARAQKKAIDERRSLTKVVEQALEGYAGAGSSIDVVRESARIAARALAARGRPPRAARPKRADLYER